MLNLQCVQCKKKYPADGKLLTCPNHNPKFSYLEVIYNYSKIKVFPSHRLKGWNRYISLLPVSNLQVTLNEVSTEAFKLVKLGKLFGYSNLYLKDETREATGSFKDKESLISINKAVELGYKKVFSISSGNGAVSASAYSTKARIPCECFVSEHTTKAKLDMIEIFGGKTRKLPGTYEQVYQKVIKMNPAGWNITSGFNPYGNEGDKITAFEIWESIGVPDYVVVPCGNGGNLYGIWKGFYELKLLGKTKKIPKMIGVQVAKAAPLKEALKKKKWYVSVKNVPHSVAEGIIASESYTSPKAIKALALSGGKIITVNDSEIISAFDQVSKTEVVILEITSASAFAAIPKLKCAPKDKIVVILTGTGMKYLSYLRALV